jgi:hypothetical protein
MLRFKYVVSYKKYRKLITNTHVITISHKPVLYFSIKRCTKVNVYTLHYSHDAKDLQVVVVLGLEGGLLCDVVERVIQGRVQVGVIRPLRQPEVAASTGGLEGQEAEYGDGEWNDSG